MMKSSLGKLGRKLSMNRRADDHHHRPSPQLDELAHASKDMNDMRDCYDFLLSASAATANSIYEFSESLNEMGTCLLDKTTVDTDDESGRALSAMGNMQSELQKIADTYRSYVILTVTNPTESLLSELRKVEEMKLQCDEKREAYEYMMKQQREKGRLRSGKGENSVVEKLEEAQDEYNEVARLCAFRVKSLKEGQRRSLLAQTARHHAAQLDFFRKGVKALEAVEPHIRIIAEKHHIDCQLNDVEGEGVSGYDDGELSFVYRQKKHGFATSSNPMELDRVDVTYPQASNLADSEINVNRYQGEQHFSRQARVSSYSAPLYPEKIDPSRETQPARKFYSYVLPPPVVDTKTPISRTPNTSVSHTNPFQNSQHLLPDEKHERGIGDDNTSTSASIENKEGNGERFSFPQLDAHDGKAVKRQAYSGPLRPSKTFSGKMTLSPGVPISHSVSPPPLSSPKISELHELPRPPPPTTSSSGLTLSTPVNGLIGGHSTPLFLKNQERTILTSNPLPPPHPLPLVVPRSFSIPSSNQRATTFHVSKLMESNPGQVSSPPLTPISLAKMKLLSTSSEVASDMARV